MKARLPLIAALAVTLAPLEASAQAWVSNPDFSEGVGIRVGNFELHPSLGAEFGYDSNYFRASETEGVIDVFKFRVTPSLTLSNLHRERRNATTPPNVEFRAGGHASYLEVVPAGSENVSGANRRNISGGADARVDIFPQRKVGFDIAANYLRVVETEGATEDLAGDGFNRGTLRGGAGATWRPGGGLFEWRLGYQATYHYFDRSDLETLRNVQHDINTRGRWRFLPRSALLFDSSYIFVRYLNSDTETQQTSGDILRSRIGFHGLVTYHLALMGMLGWTSSFYKGHDGSNFARQFDSVIGQAEARWFIQQRPDLDAATVATGLSSIAVGYSRSFSNSYYGSFYQRDRGYTQFNAFILGALVGGLEFGVSRVAFPQARADQPGFTQLRLDAQAFGEYRFTDTVAANATIMYSQVNTDKIVNNEDLDFRRWQAFVGVRWFM